MVSFSKLNKALLMLILSQKNGSHLHNLGLTFNDKKLLVFNSGLPNLCSLLLKCKNVKTWGKKCFLDNFQVELDDGHVT